MINNWTGVGRMTDNPELKYTQSQIPVTNFNLAIERNYTNATGERETDFIQIVAWRKTAEIIADMGVKGSLVGITGNIQTRNYENNQGQRVYVTEIVADSFQMLEPKSVTDKRRNNAHGGNQTQGQVNNQSNYQNSTQSNFSGNQGGFNHDDPFENNPDIEISDDDLPFDFAPMR